MKNNALKGSLYIALGASSYGMLATFVKIAYQENYTTAEVTLSQYGLGFLGLLILNLFQKKNSHSSPKKMNFKSTLKLIMAGSSLGLTSTFYYLSVQYIPVSAAIVLLMQTVWIGAVLETILYKKFPEKRKIVSIVLVLIGTLLAVNLIKEAAVINWKGFLYGMLAALSYTATMYSSNNIELHLPPLKRSLYMILGGLIVVIFIFHSSINQEFTFDILLNWGIVLSLFGTILPPLLFTKGMPLTGMGLGAIVASIEIPVSIFIAYIWLSEAVSLFQWVGILLILFAVVLMNLQKK
ncbi:DMT family transporter [Flavobacterium sp. Root186]|uniref:EamA family transporter n=1 Tax=Flavobacterium sp. Root186 TaxID=1736485 RepID=UPI0006FE7D55|nr:DMT family transporter [Flavobacterium sp. Root186]KRB59605.1 permease [Flavobacterium sp. Root186]